MSGQEALICLDSGTTNTRGWLLVDGEIVKRASVMAGVRDTARSGSNKHLREAVAAIITELRLGESLRPDAVVAAGMITSSLGLLEVPHVEAPAGVKELAAGIRVVIDPEVTELPMAFVPGVKTVASGDEVEELPARDLMRGEETLCLGIAAGRLVPLPCLVLNLGSHWKSISIGEHGDILKSVTSLAGEMIHAIQTQTILASALPEGQVKAVDEPWACRGMTEAASFGLSRAAFCVRLLEQAGQGSDEQRMSYLIGAFIEAELEGLVRSQVLSKRVPILITGGGPLAGLWESELERRGYSARSLNGDTLESVYLDGLQRVWRARA